MDFLSSITAGIGSYFGAQQAAAVATGQNKTVTTVLIVVAVIIAIVLAIFLFKKK